MYLHSRTHLFFKFYFTISTNCSPIKRKIINNNQLIFTMIYVEWNPLFVNKPTVLTRKAAQQYNFITGQAIITPNCVVVGFIFTQTYEDNLLYSGQFVDNRLYMFNLSRAVACEEGMLLQNVNSLNHFCVLMPRLVVTDGNWASRVWRCLRH